MRVGLFVAVWLVLQLVTPLRGLWAAVVAIVISGLISVVLLNRQRSAMGGVVGGFFRGINERIDAASRAEDIPDDEAEGQQSGVGDHQGPGADKGRDEPRADGTTVNDLSGNDGQRDAE
jgi:Flp pilus assembly pilin Flp